jgi:hypothetical protein
MGVRGLLLVISGCLDLFEDLLLLFRGRSAVGLLNNVLSVLSLRPLSSAEDMTTLTARTSLVTAFSWSLLKR